MLAHAFNKTSHEVIPEHANILIGLAGIGIASGLLAGNTSEWDGVVSLHGDLNLVAVILQETVKLLDGALLPAGGRREQRECGMAVHDRFIFLFLVIGRQHDSCH